MAKITKIILAGEGGQGVQSIAAILAEAANQQGREALYIPNFGVEQRGGVSIAYLQISSDHLGSPKFLKGDFVIALSRRAIERTAQYCDSHTLFIYDSSIEAVEDILPQASCLAIPALETAKQKLTPRVFNMLILGALLQVSQIVELEAIEKALEKRLGAKFRQDPQLKKLNYQALQLGAELAEGEVKNEGRSL